MADIFDEEEAEITLEEEEIIREWEEEATEYENILREMQDEEEDEDEDEDQIRLMKVGEGEEEEEMLGRESGIQLVELEEHAEEEPIEVLRPSYDFARIVRIYKKVSDAKEKFIPKDRREYQTKLQQIDEQNHQINKYKERLCRLCRKDPITKCDEIEIARLKCCIKEALCSLNQLVKDLSCMRVPKHCEAWKEIKLATSFDEELTPVQLTYNILKAACKSRAVKERSSKLTPFSETVKSAVWSGRDHQKEQSDNKKEKDLLKCILQQLRSKRSEWNYSMTESKQVVEYTVSVESRLHKKDEYTRKARKKPKLSDDDLPTTASGRIICTDCWCDEIRTLEHKVNNIEQALKRMKAELCSMLAGVRETKTPRIKASGQEGELQRLKKYYTQLYGEFKEKNRKLLEIKKRWGSCLNIFEQNNFSDDAIVRVFRKQFKNLCNEISKLKTTLKHQSENIENYRTKLMNAKQKITEQKFLLDKIQTINSKNEDQINLELKHIKAKYQKKVQEFSNIPELVQNEQRKIGEATALRDGLEDDLRFMCREYKSLKSRTMPVDNGPIIDWKGKYEEQKHILNRIKLEYDAMLEDKLELCRKLESLTSQLNCLLFETGKMIKNCQEEAENDACSYRECSTRLERQIVDCRTDASLKEATQMEKICNVQLQTCNLQSSFESAQMQIKCLKDRLKYLANCEDNPNYSITMCSPTKC